MSKMIGWLVVNTISSIFWCEQIISINLMSYKHSKYTINKQLQFALKPPLSQVLCGGIVIIQYFSYIVAVTFIGEGNPSMDLSQVTDQLCHIMLYWVHLTMNWVWIYNLSGDSTDCTGSCKSNYHTITTMTAPYMEYVQRLCTCS
jgi:hypothetical protein